MHDIRFASAVFVLTLGFAVVTSAQTDKAFPTDEEIGLLLTQADRTIQQYSPLVNEQEVQMGKSAAIDIAKERQVRKRIRNGYRQPENSASKDSMDRLASLFPVAARRGTGNLLQCGSAASAASTGYMIAGDRDKADALLHLSQRCMDLSLLIYTISENAGSLYRRFVDAEDQWAARSTQEARQCENNLEKSRPRKLDPAF